MYDSWTTTLFPNVDPSLSISCNKHNSRKSLIICAKNYYPTAPAPKTNKEETKLGMATGKSAFYGCNGKAVNKWKCE